MKILWFWVEYKHWKYIVNMHNKVTKQECKVLHYDANTHLLSPQFTICSTIRNYCDGYKCCLTFKYFFILLPHHIYVSLGLNGMRHKSQNNVHFWLSDFWRVSLQANQICSNNDLWSCQVLLYREVPSVFFLDTY